MELEQPVDTQDSATDTGNDAPQVTETSGAQSADDDLSLDLLDPEQQPDDEAEEELEGVKLRGKKEALERIKAERLMQQDYTRKTQDLAEQRKAMEAQRAQVQQSAQMAQQYVEEIAAARALDMRLQQYGQLDWPEIEQADPSQALRLQREMRDLQAAKEQISHSIAQKHQQRTLEQQQELARLSQEGEAVLAREIKGWGQETKAKLSEFALSRGFGAADLANVYDPKVVRLLHDAYTLHQLREQAKQKPKPQAQPAPVTRLSGPKSTAAKDPERMSTDEWMAWRNAQIKRK